jgi:hypothetical protein
MFTLSIYICISIPRQISAGGIWQPTVGAGILIYMEIITDPNDPRMREALDKLGAPSWYPQEAPTHDIIFTREDDHVIMECAEGCGWIKIAHDEGALETIDKGYQWAKHCGSSFCDLKITDISVSDVDDNLEPFSDFLNNI